MILLDLFLTFLLIGAVSFGGGYGMISLVREQVLAHGWLTESEFLDMIAVSESTPGPLAVNMATFIGSSQCGIGGALAATAGSNDYSSSCSGSTRSIEITRLPSSTRIKITPCVSRL